MLPFFWYMLKVMICSGILFGYYWFFLRNKIFHQYNRFYLLAAMSLSLLLPLLKINFWQPAADTNQAIRVLQAVSVGDEYMENIVLTARRSNWSVEQLYPVFYILVSLIFFIVMLRTLFLIRTLLKKYPVQQVEQVAFINTQDDSTPFSFLKYIFWNSSIDLETTTGRQIFKHEVAHIQEKHTHDKLFVNSILIFCWCNPFFWLYRKELNMIHEFIADKKAVEDSDTSAFAAMILQAAYPRHRFELANNFFYSPIKRRLLMLTKNKNPRVNYIGRIMVLPLAVLIFAAFTFKTKSSPPVYNGKKITVVIDAGHGGQDAGAKSADGILEKDLTLAIAKKVKELNSNNAIEIVLVRDGDVYMNPQQKVEFAKSKNADLVISFHVDNGPKELADTKTGMSVFVAKDEFANAAKSKTLATVIVKEFSNNYGLTVKPQLNQRQMGIMILQANTCPAVLIEAGFINNEKDLAYLQTSAAKETIAKFVAGN
ncbi:MAG: N-acetylmuramoyl-L-alanine amidase [Chitinophagaceae bacterium]|nr:N-acetylmuramoyl-L-alanine amidase [Chitinophagaceae bacterium]